MGSWDLVIWVLVVLVVEAGYLLMLDRFVRIGHGRIALVLYGGGFLAILLFGVALSAMDPSTLGAVVLIAAPLVLVGFELVRVSIRFGKAKRESQIGDRESG